MRRAIVIGRVDRSVLLLASSDAISEPAAAAIPQAVKVTVLFLFFFSSKYNLSSRQALFLSVKVEHYIVCPRANVRTSRRWGIGDGHDPRTTHPAMPHIQVELASFNVSSSDIPVSLTVSTSIDISLPSETSRLISASQLVAAVSSGDLWVTRAGSCRLDVGWALDGQAAFLLEDIFQTEDLFAEAVQQAPVGPRLHLGHR